MPQYESKLIKQVEDKVFDWANKSAVYSRLNSNATDYITLVDVAGAGCFWSWNVDLKNADTSYGRDFRCQIVLDGVIWCDTTVCNLLANSQHILSTVFNLHFKTSAQVRIRSSNESLHAIAIAIVLID